MGLFDSKWIVEFEVSKGILSSNKKGTMTVEASSQSSAESKAKAALKVEYSYVKILSAHKSSGRNEENKVTYAPKTTTVEYQTSSQIKPERQLGPAERESLLREMKQREEIRKQKRKLDDIKRKAKAYKRAQVFHIYSVIISGVISLVAFLFGWIPHWVSLFMAAASKSQLDAWIELGHSETDKTGQEFAENIAKYSAQANATIWIPFVVLGIGIAITVLVFFLAKKKTPIKTENAEKEMKRAVSEYEDEYGKLIDKKS